MVANVVQRGFLFAASTTRWRASGSASRRRCARRVADTEPRRCQPAPRGAVQRRIEPAQFVRADAPALRPRPRQFQRLLGVGRVRAHGRRPADPAPAGPRPIIATPPSCPRCCTSPAWQVSQASVCSGSHCSGAPSGAGACPCCTAPPLALRQERVAPGVTICAWHPASRRACGSSVSSPMMLPGGCSSTRAASGPGLPDRACATTTVRLRGRAACRSCRRRAGPAVAGGRARPRGACEAADSATPACTAARRGPDDWYHPACPHTVRQAPARPASSSPAIAAWWAAPSCVACNRQGTPTS